jgi:hypothetical protein
MKISAKFLVAFVTILSSQAMALDLVGGKIHNEGLHQSFALNCVQREESSGKCLVAQFVTLNDNSPETFEQTAAFPLMDKKMAQDYVSKNWRNSHSSKFFTISSAGGCLVRNGTINEQECFDKDGEEPSSHGAGRVAGDILVGTAAIVVIVVLAPVDVISKPFVKLGHLFQNKNIRKAVGGLFEGNKVRNLNAQQYSDVVNTLRDLAH